MQVESSSGEDSYSADEKDKNSPPDGEEAEDDGQYATLETVDAKYLSNSIDNLYKATSHDVNVIEFKDTIHAQPYSLETMPTYFPEESSAVNGHVTESVPQGQAFGEAQEFIKYEKYNGAEDPSHERDAVNYGPYSFAPQSLEAAKSRETSYAYPLPVVKHAAADNWAYGNTMAPASKAAVFLCNRELWAKFHTHTTEMIVTKQGR